ncbi:MAG: hypothetical protein JNK85_01690 [Verrucomicrobiales bacterium]|nr:hypothetical protein [Verrucomicrobiales bacterium]
MHLIVVHYHYRPGGVRRVIELGTPHVLRAIGDGPHRVTLAGGEAPDAEWLAGFQRAIGRERLTTFCDAALGYTEESRLSGSALMTRVEACLESLIEASRAADTVVWAHNLGLGRNIRLTAALMGRCEALGVRMVAHHHDWWFDHRWGRWAEMKRLGVRTLAGAAQMVFGAGGWVRHAAINQADARILRRLGRGQSGWMPNLVERSPAVSESELCEAREWLTGRLGDAAPVWLLPCRYLRRKNVGEALLVTRWLRPEAWMVTTGGPSSVDEQPSYRRWQENGRRRGWRFRLGILAGVQGRVPTVAALAKASEAMLLTSVQEGFGLPYLEAAAAGRPLVCRRLRMVEPDLRRFGFRFPHAYREVWIDPSLFDLGAERARQAVLFREWRARLPTALQRGVEPPELLTAGGGWKDRPVAMSRLTMTAQLEVLKQPLERSWELSCGWNSWLLEWRQRSVQNGLAGMIWSENAEEWLTGKAYEVRFRQLLYGGRRPIGQHEVEESLKIQQAFLESRMAPEHQYPLLWSPET